VVLCLTLTACDPFGIVNRIANPPPPPCETFAAVTALAATDGGSAQVTVGCNQAPVSACDGGEPPACPSTACVEVDWIAVAPSFNGSCSNAAPQSVGTQSSCVALVNDAGVQVPFVAPVRLSPPFITYAHLGDGGLPGCDLVCAQSAATCVCDAALGGSPGEACATLR
jgi:hypothetical protein